MENIGTLIATAQKLHAEAQDAKFAYMLGQKSIEDYALSVGFCGGFIAALASAYGIDSDLLKLVIEN